MIFGAKARLVFFSSMFGMLCIGFLACAGTNSNQSPPPIYVDGLLLNLNQGDKCLTQERMRVRYDCTVEAERKIEARGRTEKIKEEVPLGWGVNELTKKQKWVSFRLDIDNPAKIAHQVSYFQKVDGKIVQKMKEPQDHIWDRKTHYVKFPVLESGKVVDFGAIIQLMDEKKTVYAEIVADGFRYISRDEGH